MTTLTYRQAMSWLHNIADAHFQIKYFGVGELPEINQAGVRSIKLPGFPCLWVRPEPSAIRGNTMTYSFRLILFDQHQRSEEMELDTVSDTFSMLLDVIKVLRNNNEDFYLVGEPVLEPFTERFSDSTVGWSALCDLQVNLYQDDCDVPIGDFITPAVIAGGISVFGSVSGYSGYSGMSGQGESGFSGMSGDSTSGSSGVSGFSGQDAAGESGVSGFTGASGESGASGYSGQVGASGLSGFTGVSGYSGYTGVSGFSGYSGASGLVGTSGFSGYSGSSGFSGSGLSGFSGIGTSGFSGASAGGATYVRLLAANGDAATTLDTQGSITNGTQTLSFAVAANSTYAIQLNYRTACNGAGGMRFGVTMPASCTFAGNHQGFTTAATSQDFRNFSITSSGTMASTAFNATGASTAGAYIAFGILYTGANSGTFTLTWASVTAGQTSTVFANGTYLKHQLI